VAGTSALVAGTLALMLVLMEAFARLAMPELVPRGSSPATGMPVGAVERAARACAAERPDVVVIGDSFVETGARMPGGWVERVRAGGVRVAAIGFSAICPSQYFALLDAVRGEGVRAPAVLVLYLANDLVEEALWSRLGSDRSRFPEARHDYFADPDRPSFFPCLSRETRGLGRFLGETSVLYRATVLATGLPRLSGPKDPVEQLRAFQEERCGQPPWAERVGGRIFFFRLHEAVSGDEVAAEGRTDVLKVVHDRGREPGLAFVALLSREENCRSFHGRPVTAQAPLIGELRALGASVYDPNPAFQGRCKGEELYLPDGHWNLAGHTLFAEQMLPHLAELARRR